MVRLLLFVVCFVASFAQDTNLQIYNGTTGQLVNGWENWSWATVNFQDTTFVRSGSKYSVSAVMNNWEALYLEGSFGGVESQLKTLHFWINGGTSGGEPVLVKVISGNNLVGNAIDINTVLGGPIPANTWVEANIPWTMFGAIDNKTILSGIWWEANTASLSGTIYLDDIYVVEGPAPPPTPPADQTTVIDIDTNAHPISPNVFGVNFASADQIKSNKYPVNRWGGNAVTRYAYDLDTNNHASDWFFEDIANDVADPSKLPYGSSSDSFINDTLSNNAQVQLTIPTIGWTPFDRTRRCGFSVAKYGNQQNVDPDMTDCGNGIDKSGNVITGNDPHDTSREINETYVGQWLDHIEAVFGTTLNQKLVLLYDNEPCLWANTHRDVHPQPMSYDELWNRTVQYGSSIKKRSNVYQTYGPIFWGWCAYMFSPIDGNCVDGPDRKAHGDLPFLEWYVKQVGDYRSANGVQLVDVIDVHYYPQESNVALSSAEDPATAALRLKSTRSLWDPDYVDDSWIGQPIYLIPRMRGYISAHSPGLKTGISEWNFGNDEIITGALASAEAMAIFARENLHAAARWVVPASGTITESAFAIFLNYDGKGANLLNSQSVSASTSDIDTVGSYGFVDNTNVYVLLIFKDSMAGNVTIDVTSATLGAPKANIYRFEQNKPLYYAGQAQFTGGRAKVLVPGWSASLYVVPRS